LTVVVTVNVQIAAIVGLTVIVTVNSAIAR
jgi:hypothetical protein